ncbi:Uncharacterised protein [Mycobacteroides abscessus]|nr:Uncharacterised protein [Mycobacteroides abscessus]
MRYRWNATAASTPCSTPHVSSVGTTSRMPRWLTRSGWSSAARNATSAPRSWPTRTNRSTSSASASATTSAAMVRLA